MKLNLSKYQTLVFDCDGVILNSNKVKTQAFYESTKAFGLEAAQALVNYHVEHGGVSRFEKFKYFYECILKVSYSQKEFDILVKSYAEKVEQALLECDVAMGLDELREKTRTATWLIASGGAQDELRDVFGRRGLTKFFDGGIYGSPTAKDDIVGQQIKNGVIQFPALFLGDSRYDHEVAMKFNLDFVFLSKWSEFTSLDEYAGENGVMKLDSLINLCDLQI